MDQILVCPNNHRWAAAGLLPECCPVCGTAPVSLAAAAEDSGRTVAQTFSQAEVSSGDLPPTMRGSGEVGRENQPSTDKTLAPDLPTGALAVGRTIDNTYEILGELGRGGMGVVYKARQVRLNRLVALKMILAGSHASPEQLARFRAEAEALAPLQHPNIVQVYEAGELEGHPYVALEYVEGGSLAQKLAGNPQPARQAAQLVEALARAMHFAHLRGIVHRDLKPANVLLQVHASSSVALSIPKITDFGLAKNLESDSGHTKTGAILGTPSYISPEQALGRKEIGPATDIYALGAILYELLTGRPPFRGESSMDTMLQVTTEEPVPPRRLQPKVPADLETICLKCLQKQPHKRYRSAEALADDLKRFLAGEPIQARPVGMAERALKWARRRPALATSLTVGCLAILGMLGGSLYHSVDVTRLNDKIQQRALELAAQKDKAEKAWQRAEEESQHARAAQKRAEEQQRFAEERLENSLRSNYAFQLVQVAALAQHDPRQGLELLQDEDRCPVRLRDFTWHYLNRLCQREKATLTAGKPAVQCLALASDGKTLASAGGDENVLLWDLEKKQLTRTLKTNHAGPIVALAFAPTAPLLATGGFDKTVRLYDLDRGDELTCLAGHSAGVRAVAFSPDGKTLASGSHDHTILLWDVAGHRPRATLRGHRGAVSALAFSTDGQMLASAGGEDRTVRLWDVGADKELGQPLQGHDGQVLAVAFAPGGRLLASAGSDRTIKLWHLADRKPAETLQGHLEAVHALAFTSDGKTLASAGADCTIRLWHPGSGEMRTTLKGHTQPVMALLFSRDGQTLVSSSSDQTIKVWECWTGAGSMPYRIKLGWEQARGSPLAWGHDGRTLATVSHADKVLRFWDLREETERIFLTGFTARFGGLSLAPDGKTLAGAMEDHTIRLYETDKARLRGTLKGHQDRITCLAFAPDSSLLASGSADRTVRLWDAAGKPLGILPIQAGPIHCLAYSADGRMLAIGNEQSLKLWDLAQRKLVADLEPSTKQARQLAFAPDGQTLAVVGGAGRTFTLWDTASWRKRSEIKEPRAPVQALAFSPDSKVLATGHKDWNVMLWDARTGQQRATLRGHTQPVQAVSFTADGQTLIALGEDGTVLRWQAGK